VLDLLFLKKDEDGSLEAFKASDLGESEIGELRGYEKDLAMVLSEQDVADLAETIEPGSSAAVLVWENLGPRRSARRCAAPGASWPPAAAFPSRRCWPPSRPTPGKEPDMPLAARRRRRTVAAVGGAVVVAHGINRRVTDGRTAATTGETAVTTGATTAGVASSTNLAE
jgi:hypothetical protein